MKTNLRTFGAAAVLSAAFLTHPAVAQTAVTETTSVGTVSSFSPDTIQITSDAAPAPAVYRYTKSTTYVDETGAPVSVETVKSGLPVTVYYTKDGDNMIASKVVVRRATTTTAPATPVIQESTTTTTTTTSE